MVDPVTLATIGAVAGVAGAGVSAYGAYSAGQAKSSQAQFQSGIALRNQKIAMQNADYTRQVGEVDAQASGLRTAQVIGQQKAGQGASGLDVNFGSAVQVRDSQAEVGWHDQQVIRSNAARKAYAYDQEAVTQGMQAEMYSKAGADASSAGVIGAATSILGGVTSVSSKWMQASTLGIGSTAPAGSHNSGAGVDIYG